MSNPPAAALALLEVVLRPGAREAVSGDLLEEYRETRVTALGKRRADVWYWRQVLGVWLRTYWIVVVPLLLILITGNIFHTFRTPSGASYLDRFSAPVRVVFSPWAAIGFFAIAGAYGSGRTRSAAGGIVAALGTFTAMWLFEAIWSTATFYPFALVQQSNPYWLQAWQWSTHPPGAAHAGFLNWLYWDNVGGLILGGGAALVASILCGGLGSALELVVRRRRSAGIRSS